MVSSSDVTWCYVFTVNGVLCAYEWEHVHEELLLGQQHSSSDPPLPLQLLPGILSWKLLDGRSAPLTLPCHSEGAGVR